jgi:hypothetical protein
VSQQEDGVHTAEKNIGDTANHNRSGCPDFDFDFDFVVAGVAAEVVISVVTVGNGIGSA